MNGFLKSEMVFKKDKLFLKKRNGEIFVSSLAFHMYGVFKEFSGCILYTTTEQS